MPGFIRDRKGQFAGSVGSGKTKAPMPAPSRPTGGSGGRLGAGSLYAGMSEARQRAAATAAGREVVVGASVSDCRAQVSTGRSEVAVTLCFRDGAKARRAAERLREAGFNVGEAPAYGKPGTGEQSDWTISTWLTGEGEIVSRRFGHDDAGWSSAERAFGRLRGRFLRRGAAPDFVKAEAA